ncbi:MAG: glycosyltransferase family 4 protein [Myxococcales bacterium]|nr:glycosyltransferase family 4 protein [Myxococcales bacterium]
MSSLRLGVVQRVLPSYRVPVFQALARQVDLTLYVGTDPKSSLPDAAPQGLTVVPTPFRTVGPFHIQPGALGAALARRHDVLVLPWETAYVFLVPAVLAARARGMKVLVWGHGYSKTERPLRRMARNAMARLADGALFYARPAAERCVAEGFRAERVFVAPNAQDQAPIRAARAKWPAARLQAFIEDQGLRPARAGGDGVLIFSSRLEPDKGVDLLLEAFAALQARRPGAQLLIIGDGSHRAALEAQAQGLTGVRFLGAVYEEETLAGWFSAADLFAYPKAIGLSLLHACGYGLPTVTSDDEPGHNPEFVALEPGVNGALYRDGDANDFARVMDDLLADPARLTALSQGARRTAEIYTVEAMAQGFTDAARAVLGR